MFRMNYSHFQGRSTNKCHAHLWLSQCILSCNLSIPLKITLNMLILFWARMTLWPNMSLSVCEVAIETRQRFCHFARIWMHWTPVLHSFKTCEICRLRGYLQRDYKSLTWTSIKDQRLRGAEGSGTASLIMVCLFKCSYIKSYITVIDIPWILYPGFAITDSSNAWQTNYTTRKETRQCFMWF